MADFMIRFCICNIFISVIIGILFITKRLLKNILSNRMQYNLWLVLLGLLAVPFIPVHPISFLRFFSWLGIFHRKTASNAIEGNTAAHTPSETAGWLNDFALSVSKETPSIAGQLLFWIWITGILAMLVLVIRSQRKLHTLKKSALPLQNQEVRRLYRSCLEELNITKDIPVYSTAFLKSPVIVGLCKPCIYLPIHLISDYHARDMRYMLLHELQHYRHKDALGNLLMSAAGILYWFHPLVWYVQKEMRSDRELACDTSVLNMLKEEDYEDYGNTLISFAERMSLTPFPFAAGISGNMKQMKKRIRNIASYEKPSARKQLKGIAAFCFAAIFLLCFSPALSTCKADEIYEQWNVSSEKISYPDLSAYFGEYEGSFVLYDLEEDSWKVHNMKRAALRVSPDSTYKIYTALWGLEENMLTPENSFRSWNRQTYPFDAWNADQDLKSAMSASVNWYFQEIDEQLGASCVSEHLREIGYGNENISGGFPTYWMESSLKISPIEQVKLLVRLYNNDFGFDPENIHAVKESICLSSSETGSLYGKTGTGEVDGQDVNGWFVGYVEGSGHTCFFALNITADANASGSTASKIALSILSDMNIWK